MWIHGSGGESSDKDCLERAGLAGEGAASTSRGASTSSPRPRRLAPLSGALVSCLVLATTIAGLSGCSEPTQEPDRRNTCIVDLDCADEDYECVGGVCMPKTSTGCTRDSQCPEGMRCHLFSGECVAREGLDPDQICHPGDTRCDGSLTLQTCDEEGKAWLDETCELECRDGACTVCVPGEKTCVGSLSQVCARDGTAWNEEDCAEKGVGCEDGLCQLCVPGARRCYDETGFEICNDHGSNWDDYPCLDGACDEESAECVGCTPGDSVGCDGNNLIVCAEDGETWDVLEDCLAADAICERGQCVNLCEDAVRTNSYIGCEYWPVVLSNSQLDSIFHDDYAVVVANPNPEVAATVRVFKHGSSSPVVTRQVAGGQLEIIRLPWNAMPARTGTPRRGVSQRGHIAYRLESTVPVTAYQFNPLLSKRGSVASYTNDASLLLPSHVYGSESRYIAVALPHARIRDNDTPSYLAIVGTQDDTTVNIRLRGYSAAGGGLNQMGPGSDTTITLNRHEVIQIASRAAGTHQSGDAGSWPLSINVEEYRQSDMSGTMIGSDKPIAVYTGADCRYVPFDKQACDHMEQQLFPYQNWGHSYIGAVAHPPPGGASSAGDFWRVIAVNDGTQVTFTNNVHSHRTLNAGEWVQFQTNKHFLVSSQSAEHPIMLSQFLVGQLAHGGSMGDPSMILVAPVEQYLREFHFTAPTTIARNYVNAVRPSGGTVRLNGNPIPASDCTAVPGTTFEVCRRRIDGGTHTVVADEPIGLVVYGFDETVSYGYLGGLDLRTLIDPNTGW